MKDTKTKHREKRGCKEDPACLLPLPSLTLAYCDPWLPARSHRTGFASVLEAPPLAAVGTWFLQYEHH